MRPIYVERWQHTHNTINKVYQSYVTCERHEKQVALCYLHRAAPGRTQPSGLLSQKGFSTSFSSGFKQG
jgi:hypothetical protein